MPYPVNKSDGSLLVTIQDNVRDTQSTSITLLGRGCVNYGEAIAENLVHILENFSSPTPPVNPLVGQTWFHNFDPGPPPQTINKIKVWTGAKWMVVGGAVKSTTAPTSPEAGDIWYNPDTKMIYYWDGEKWISIGTPQGEELPPSNPTEGQLWWMLPEKQLFGYATNDQGNPITPDPRYKRADGSLVPEGWVLIGPIAPATTNSQIIYDTVEDSSGTEYDLLKIYIEGTLVAVWAGSAFEPTSPIEAGFQTYDQTTGLTNALKPGLNINQAFGAVLNGTATNSDLLDGLDSLSFLRRDQSDYPSTDNILDLGTPDNRWRRLHAAGFYGGTSDALNDDVSNISFHGKATRSESSDSSDVWSSSIDLTLTGGYIQGGFTDIDGSANKTATFTFTTAGEDKINELATEIVKQEVGDTSSGAYKYVPLTANSVPTGGHNMGNSSQRWGTIYANTFDGLATSANYADLAERFASDQIYSPGTIVKLGGEYEITQTTKRNDIDVLGVISTDPGFLMNSMAGNNESHPPVAFSGRVPVRVKGPVNKGSRLISSDIPGVAEAVNSEDLITNNVTSYAIIGRALEESLDNSVKLILCIVGAK